MAAAEATVDRGVVEGTNQSMAERFARERHRIHNHRHPVNFDGVHDPYEDNLIARRKRA